MLRALVSEFRKPSPRNPVPHHRGATGYWHHGAGLYPGAVFSLMDVAPLAAAFWAALVVGLGYWLIKERGDLKRGGGLRDGIEDAVFVAVGAAGGALAPVAALVVAPAHVGGLIVMAAQLRR